MIQPDVDDETLRKEQFNDPDLLPIIEQLIQNNKHDKFILEQNILYKLGKGGSNLIVVPLALVERILTLYHNNKLIVHPSSSRLYGLLCKRFYWLNMHQDCVNWTSACETCQKHKLTRPISHGLLFPIISNGPMEKMNMDIKGPYKVSKNGYKYVLVAVDQFTSWPEAMPLKGIAANEVALSFFKLVISRHGCPEVLITDRGSQLVGKIMSYICKLFNIKHEPTDAMHQPANGKVEKFNDYLHRTLSTVIKDDQSDWDDCIENCLFTYRISLNRVLKDNPFYLIYGRDAVVPQDLFLPINKNQRKVEKQQIDEYKIDLVSSLRNAYEKLNKDKTFEQNKYKQYYDKTHKEVNFDKDDLVWLYYKPQTNDKTLSVKFLANWKGPFKVVNKINSINYRIKDIDSEKTQVVHVSRIRKYRPWLGPTSSKSILRH